MDKKKWLGAALATAAAGFLTAGPLAAMTDNHNNGMSANVHCMGVNACKGKSSCKSAHNACKGQNSCKGKGVVGVSKEACDQLGGTVDAGDSNKEVGTTDMQS